MRPCRGVCSAGLASTVLPVTSAALTCPVKIETGKFHGLMQAITPRPRTRKSIALSGRTLEQLRRAQGTRLQGVVTQKIDGFAHFGRAVGHGAARLQHTAGNKIRSLRFE